LAYKIALCRVTFFGFATKSNPTYLATWLCRVTFFGGAKKSNPTYLATWLTK